MSVPDCLVDQLLFQNSFRKLIIRHKYSFLGIESSRACILDTVYRMIRNTHVTTKGSCNVNDDLFPKLAVFENNLEQKVNDFSHLRRWE